MFDNINKSKIAFEDYIKLKEESLTKSYTEKFKWVDKFLYWFSWFGNGVSIFLAFFFVQAIFLSSFNDVKDSILITLGIIFFLTMFELLKRYVIAIFSTEVIKNKFKVLKWNMMGFIFGVLLLAGGSAYLSLSGAMKFVNNEQVFKEQTETTITSVADSLTRVYEDKKKPYVLDNEQLRTITNNLRGKLAETPVGYVTIRKQYQENIDKNDINIKSNQSEITRLDNELNTKIADYKSSEGTKLGEMSTQNKSNMLAFIIISAFIEIIILLGIYYDKYYDFKIVEEYEKTIIETPGFKKWYKYNYLLGLIYSRTKEVGEAIPSSNAILEMAEVGGNKLDKATLDKFIKILYFLEIVKLEGNKRILNMTEEEGIKKLRYYFDIK
jgi:hypothetical protein